MEMDMCRTLGVFGRMLLRLPSVLSLIGVWSWVGVLLWHVPLGWEVLKFVRRVGILRIHLRESDVFMYHGPCWFKAVGDVLHAVIRDEVTLARSLELWDGILRIGPVFPFTLQDFDKARRGGLGVRLQLVEGLHRRPSDFIHRVVVYRREEAILEWRNGLREDPLVHPYKWLRPDLVLPAPILQCDPLITPGGSGFLADPTRIDEEFRKAWLPYFCRSAT